MKLIFFLTFTLMKITFVLSDAASILDEFDSFALSFDRDIDVGINDMINEYLTAGEDFKNGNDYLNTKIIRRLRRMSSRNIWASKNIFEVYKKFEVMLNNYFQFAGLRSGFSNFDGIKEAISRIPRENVNSFTTLADTAIIDDCWNTYKSNLTDYFDTSLAVFKAILKEGPKNIGTLLDPLEAKRLANFRKHENNFRKCRNRCRCTANYVKKRFFECSYSF